MKTLSIIGTFLACLLICGFQQKPSSNQQKPGSKAASANGEEAHAGNGPDGTSSPGQPATESADKDAVAPTVPRQSDKVEVTALPPEIVIKQVKDSIDRTIMWCTIILTIVGTAGTVVAVWTLLVIKKQAKIMDEHRVSLEQLAKAAQDNAAAASKNAEFSKLNADATKESAEAALLNAQAVISAEVAWVSVDLVQMAVKMPPPENWCRIVNGGMGVMSAEAILRGEHLRHRLKFTNMGRTAARITEYEFHCGFFDHKRDTLQIEHISYNGDYNRMLGAGNETLTNEVVSIHEFVNNPAAEIGPPTWKNWMIVLVSVT